MPAATLNDVANGSIPFPGTSPKLWDILTLGGQQLPGVVKITGGLKRKLEVRSPPNSDGASLRDRGYQPAQIKLVWKIWTSDQWSAMQPIYANLIALATSARRTAMSFAHPATDLSVVTSVYLEEVGIWRPSSDHGVYWYLCDLGFVQFKPPTARPATAVTSGTLVQQHVGFPPTNTSGTASNNGATQAPSSNGAASPPGAGGSGDIQPEISS